MAGTPLNIKDPEAYRLARLLATHTGKSLTRVVVDALQHETERVIPKRWDQAAVDAALARIDALPDLDPRPSEEILADLYDEKGLWR